MPGVAAQGTVWEEAVFSQGTHEHPAQAMRADPGLALSGLQDPDPSSAGLSRPFLSSGILNAATVGFNRGLKGNYF